MEKTFVNKNRPSWEEYFIQIAKDVAQRGTCMSAKGGCIIVKNNRILSTGYIGAPRKTKDCIERGSCLRRELNIPSGHRYELCRSVHAEQNAIINAARDGVSVKDADMFLYMEKIYQDENKIITAYPCFICKKIVINAGIKNFYGLTIDGEIAKYSVENWVNDWSQKDLIDDNVKHDANYNKN